MAMVGSRNPKSKKYTKVSEEKIQEFRDKGMSWALKEFNSGNASEEHQEAVRRMYPSAYDAGKDKYKSSSSKEKPEAPATGRQKNEKPGRTSRAESERPRSRANNAARPSKGAIERRFNAPKMSEGKRYAQEMAKRGFAKSSSRDNSRLDADAQEARAKARAYNASKKPGLLSRMNSNVSNWQKNAAAGAKANIDVVKGALGIPRNASERQKRDIADRVHLEKINRERSMTPSEAGRALAAARAKSRLNNRKLAPVRRRTGMDNRQLNKMR